LAGRFSARKRATRFRWVTPNGKRSFEIVQLFTIHDTV
jgi:hypothetical protein